MEEYAWKMLEGCDWNALVNGLTDEELAELATDAWCIGAEEQLGLREDEDNVWSPIISFLKKKLKERGIDGRI